MPIRILPLLLLLPSCVFASPRDTTLERLRYLPPYRQEQRFLRRHYDDGKWNFGVGFAGGSVNFRQNGNAGFNFYCTYNILQFGRSSISLSQGLILGTEDMYGVSFPALMIVSMVAGPFEQTPNLTLNHIIAGYADFPLLLRYNFGAGARRDNERSVSENLGFYLGGGFTHVFTGYTNTFGQEAQTDFWAGVADGGIRLKGNAGGVTCIGLALEQPLRSPIGPIRNPLFFQLSLTFLTRH